MTRAANPPFSLLRRLSVTSLLAVLVTAVVSLALYRHDYLARHLEVAQKDNDHTALHLMDVLGDDLQALTSASGPLAAGELAGNPAIPAFRGRLAGMRDHQILKLRVYDPGGRIVYSSVAGEIAGTSQNPRLLNRALAGEIQHKLAFHAHFAGVSGEVHDRYVVESYVPLLRDGRTLGAFELYSDVTGAIEGVQARLLLIGMIVFAIFSALYVALFFSARGADRALRAWAAELNENARRIADSEARLRAILTTAPDGVVGIDAGGRVIEFNPAAEAIFGWKRDEILGRSMAERLIPERYRQPHHAGLERFLRTGETRSLQRRVEMSALRRDGSEFPVELATTAIREGGQTYFIGYIRDIGARKRAEADLRIAAIAFESLNGMLVTDAAGIILRVNHSFSQITGYDADEVVGRMPTMLRSGHHDQAFYAEMLRSLQAGGAWSGEVSYRRRNGEVFPAWQTISAVRGPDGRITHHVAAFADISERKQSEQHIHDLAFYDPLTRLPNRRLLLDRLRQALAASARSGRLGGLLFIDLDDFKTLNDSRGHHLGDLLLNQVAGRLRDCVRDGDSVARLGGDEFVVLLEDLSEQPAEAAAQTEGVCEKVLAAVGQPYRLEDHEHHATCSIGVTLFRGHEKSIEELLKHADLAMYRAKEAGRNTVRFFEPEMQAAVERRSRLEADFRQALRAGQLRLFYQLQVDGAGRTVGAEALVRWAHPRHGLVEPADFIAVAEETGLILPLGEWVLKTACAQLVDWSERPETAALTIAVNVSARQFRQSDFVAQVLAALEGSGAAPQRLKLELTESLLIADMEDTVAKMTELNARQVRFSLDDFGTGYSSLSYLKRLPLEQLKIDRSFVRDVLNDANDAAIVRTILALGHSLGLSVIAEGVETEAQRACLAKLGVGFFQGDLFGAPAPVEEIERLRGVDTAAV